MKTFNEIKRKLKQKGIKIVAQKATLGGSKAYKVENAEHFSEFALTTAAGIKAAYYEGRL